MNWIYAQKHGNVYEVLKWKRPNQNHNLQEMIVFLYSSLWVNGIEVSFELTNESIWLLLKYQVK